MPDIKNPQIIGALIGFAGVAIGMFWSWVLTLINRSHDNRKHIRDLSVQIALELWRHERAIVERFNAERAKEQLSSGALLNPLSARSLHEIIEHTIQFTDALTRKPSWFKRIFTCGRKQINTGTELQ